MTRRSWDRGADLGDGLVTIALRNSGPLPFGRLHLHHSSAELGVVRGSWLRPRYSALRRERRQRSVTIRVDAG